MLRIQLSNYFSKTNCALFAAIFAFTTVHAQPTVIQSGTIKVSNDGSGQYKTIQEAIDVVRAYSPGHVTIFIAKGVYHEKVLVPGWVTNVSIVGESRDSTIILWNDYSGKFLMADTVNNKKKFSTFNSYTMCVEGNDVSIENLTIKNGVGRVGQAVALHVDGDRFTAKNCNLLGDQDTLLTANDVSRQYYSNCFIEGTTDFIFGNATVVFQNCIIKSLTNSYITAASTTEHQAYGYVFLNCKLIASPECTKEYLGRPWRANAKVVFIGCEMGSHILPEGWHNWDKKENESTAYYAEYNNSGVGAVTDNRVKWSHVLSAKQDKLYSIKKIFITWMPL